MKIKYAKRSMLKNKTFTIIAIFQLVLVFYISYTALDINNKVKFETKKITRYFEDRSVYTLNNSTTEDILDNEKFPNVNNKSLNELFNYLLKSNEFIFTHQVIYPMLVHEFDGYESFSVYNNQLSEFDSKNFFQAKNVTINKNALEHFSVNVASGRMFNDNELEFNYRKDGEIPILVGSNYGKYLKVGDTIEYYRSDTGVSKAKVIGVLEENQHLPMIMMTLGDDRYVNLDNCILTGYSQFEREESMYGTMFDYNFIIFNEGLSEGRIQEIIMEIKHKFNDIGIDVNLKNNNEDIRFELDLYEEQYNIVKVTVSSIIIFTVVTLIIGLINSISKRKREFAVHIFSGAKISDIIFIIYSEVLIIMSIAFIISLNIISIQFKMLNITYVMALMFFMIFMSILVTFIPVIKLLRLGILNIIRGVE